MESATTYPEERLRHFRGLLLSKTNFGYDELFFLCVIFAKLAKYRYSIIG